MPASRSPPSASGGSSAFPLPEPKLQSTSWTRTWSRAWSAPSRTCIRVPFTWPTLGCQIRPRNQGRGLPSPQHPSRATAKGHLEWIGLGNCATADVARLLRARHGEILQFLIGQRRERSAGRALRRWTPLVITDHPSGPASEGRLGAAGPAHGQGQSQPTSEVCLAEVCFARWAGLVSGASGGDVAYRRRG